jgi:hypothetical protein
MIIAEFAALDNILPMTGVTPASCQIPFDSQDDNFEDLDDPTPDNVTDNLQARGHKVPTPGNAAEDFQAGDTFGPVENRPLPLPSYQHFQDQNAAVEVHLRQKQAECILQQIRTTIADKSFQYSHVIHVAPRKSVTTRARGTITKLNTKITTYCRAYTRCHSALVRLNAGAGVLGRFRPLTRLDVKASSALINPNVPGASSLQLSWIWQTNSATPSALSRMLRECMSKLRHSMQHEI